ncbi:MAG: D-arabinono-1,4-lactone oxidase [Gammaproteobacteria bacterium]|nr:D-arabinono-1,4-lactone oxidase [Gammaproteobacteria bacterium]
MASSPKSPELVPLYYLHERNWQASVADCAAQLDGLVEDNRHFEFFWVPGTDECLMKTLNPTDREENVSLSETEHIGPNHVILPSLREDRFNEMEFSVPAEHGMEIASGTPRADAAGFSRRQMAGRIPYARGGRHHDLFRLPAADRDDLRPPGGAP